VQKQDIEDSLYYSLERTGATRSLVANAVNTLLLRMREALEAGETVRLHGVCSLSVAKGRAPRPLKLPTVPEGTMSKQRRKVVARTSGTLLAQLNPDK